jgi:tripartite-type tricarboxylate transporter receptor subunit TctC
MSLIKYFVAAACFISPPLTFAQDFPKRPIRLVIPYTAGGAADIVGRTVAQQLSKSLNTSVVVDNRAGAGGVIGSDFAAKSTPDGHTLLMCISGPIAVSPGLGGKMPYDSGRDFAPISLVTSAPYVLVVRAASPIQSPQQLIAMAREKPGQLNFGSAGVGSTSHLAGEIFKAAAQVNIEHVPYKGSAPAMVDLMGGQIQLYFDVLSAALGGVRDGRLRAVGIASKNRFALLPDVPTFAEAGLPRYEVSAWYGVCAPSGTPLPIVDLLNKHLVAGMATPEVKERFASLGAEVATSTPAEFRSFIQGELQRWARVIKDAGAMEAPAR